MKYYVVEGLRDSGKYNAGSKARVDVEKILKELNYHPFLVRTKYGVRDKKWQKPIQYFCYFTNYFRWKKMIKDLNNGDIILIQYPLLNMTFFLKRILKKMQKRGIKTIGLIHDLDSLRLSSTKHFSLNNIRRKSEDKNLLPMFSKIISHNEVMTSFLKKYNISDEMVENLELFDYLVDGKLKLKKKKYEFPVVVAGNLSSEKAGYIRRLSELNDIEFNLYGKGLDYEPTGNLMYKGSFLPEDLPNELEGSFGLVWDGNSIGTCDGVYGKYLMYNNPHKISLYLISGLPVIVWDKSAMTKFVVENNIGFAITKLEDIQKIKDNMSEKKYDKIIKNVERISNDLLKGFYLKRAIKKIEGSFEK